MAEKKSRLLVLMEKGKNPQTPLNIDEFLEALNLVDHPKYSKGNCVSCGENHNPAIYDTGKCISHVRSDLWELYPKS